jgi:hypothetical protein
MLVFFRSFPIHPATPAPPQSAADRDITRTSAACDFGQRPNGTSHSPAVFPFTRQDARSDAFLIAFAKSACPVSESKDRSAFNYKSWIDQTAFRAPSAQMAKTSSSRDAIGGLENVKAAQHNRLRDRILAAPTFRAKPQKVQSNDFSVEIRSINRTANGQSHSMAFPKSQCAVLPAPFGIFTVQADMPGLVQGHFSQRPTARWRPHVL